MCFESVSFFSRLFRFLLSFFFTIKKGKIKSCVFQLYNFLIAHLKNKTPFISSFTTGAIFMAFDISLVCTFD